jgi:predicted unusual protein kinase regulating ubiquinone biosynthesis (AarF/ABC1/UbiB family)
MSRRPKRSSFGQIARLAGRSIKDSVRGYRLRRRRTDGAGIETDPDARRAYLARMGTSLGGRMGAARLRTLGRSREKKKEILEEAAMRSAADVLDVMGNMKGAVMKLAQMASFAVDGLPDGVQKQLAQLQSAAPPMAYALVAEVVTKELGSPPEKAFAKFEPIAMAAASIGQVHRARTHDGRDVAVKVQYPGVDKAILADLQNADMLFQTIAAMFGGFNPREFLEEVVARFTEEFDYRMEAANQQYFADKYRGHAYVKIAEVLPELSAERVLTSELVKGRRFYDVLDEPQEARNQYGEIINRFVYNSINVDGIFSGDPHPGNYIFMDDGRICFLDFGLVKRLTPHEQQLVRAPGVAILRNDPALLESSLRDLGLLPEGQEVDNQRLWDFFQMMLSAIAKDEPYRYTRKKVGDTFRAVALPDSPYRDVQEIVDFPAMLVIWQRYTFGTAAVLGHLEAEANWHRFAREGLLGDPPSSELSERW